MSTLELVKNVGAFVLSTMSLVHNIFPIFIKFEQQVYKKNSGKEQKMKKLTTLHLSLHFGSLNHELSFKLFLSVWTNWFSFQNDAM